MSDLTLLVMAAGMGSRYGGLKQLDPVGPNGETIIDYSVYDAIRAGFNKVVFIVRDEFKSDFENQITNKYNNSIAVEFSIQDIDQFHDYTTYKEHIKNKKFTNNWTEKMLEEYIKNP